MEGAAQQQSPRCRVVILRVDPEIPTPPYEQIREQITTMIATGVLPEETRLPPIRQLASDLGLAGGTVARAYKELEAQGAIATRGRHGTFVTGKGISQKSGETLSEAAGTFALRVKQLGITTDEALASARRAIEELAPG